MGQKGREQVAVRKIRTDKCLKRQELQRNESGDGGDDVLGGADKIRRPLLGVLNSPGRASAALTSIRLSLLIWVKSAQSTSFVTGMRADTQAWAAARVQITQKKHDSIKAGLKIRKVWTV